MLMFGSHMSSAGGCDLALARAEELELSSCQIFTKNERQWHAKPLDPAVVERFHAQKERTGIGLIISHDSYLINLASPDDTMWAKSLAAFGDEIDRCATLGIPSLVTHPGAHLGSGEDAGIARIAEGINRIFDERPDDPTMVLLETTAGQGTSLGRTFEELAGIAARVEDQSRLGVCLDTCHVFAAGYDLRTLESYRTTISQFETIVGLVRLKAIHINDSQKALSSRVDRHAHIGDGELGLDAFRWLVNDRRLAGIPAILETEKSPDGENDRRNLATLRKLVTMEALPSVSEDAV
ncbi:MAG: deoxyribonuclease IV [Chloroflexota bacterium]|nr:deoxyribonuclease IV [Chloroflexota bacterium]